LLRLRQRLTKIWLLRLRRLTEVLLGLRQRSAEPRLGERLSKPWLRQRLTEVWLLHNWLASIRINKDRLIAKRLLGLKYLPRRLECRVVIDDCLLRMCGQYKSTQGHNARRCRPPHISHPLRLIDF
jgi:transposase InsO family protein